VVTQVGLGLTALHDRGVLHRDVKPANVLFRTVENARGAQVVAMLGDLGLGKAMDMSSRLTMVGGTPTYVAPEQALGEPLDPRADQFSLAALTYYLLAGRQPFTHTSLTAAGDPAPPPPMGMCNADVEAVVLRALSKERSGRFDDVEQFTAALADAMGEPAGEADQAPPMAWIPVDPELTRAARTAPTGRMEDAPRPPTSSRGRRGGWAAAAVLALLVGAGVGWAAEQAATTDRTLDDATGTLSVTVPESWTGQVDPEQWTPVEGDRRLPSLAAGAREGWNTDADPASGVFVGVLEGDKLPTKVPQHPACENASPRPVFDTHDGDRSMTVVFDGCPGADITIERVIQVNENQLVWVQVRSAERATANRVLDSVQTFGI
jgi:hypothetical protein